jgi:hypothetical protein
MEKMKSKNEELSLADNRAQIELAKLAFHREHPENAAPDNNEVMLAWIQGHAAEYRKFVHIHPEMKIKLDDKEALERIYDAILESHEKGTVH